MKQKLLEIKQITIDESVYPRIHIDWVTTSRYYNALKSGAVFPPITVAEINRKYILVDGGHRLKAHKDNGETHIQTEVLNGLDMKGIYLEAVKRNSEHGRQFSTQEVTKICITLKAWNMSQEEISQIVRIPADKIEPFVAKRMVSIISTGQEIPLKSSLQNLSDMNIQEPINQTNVAGIKQVHLLVTLINLLENKWINLDDKIVVRKLKKLKQLLENYEL